MFGFFTALFGGLYYSGKYISESIKEHNSDVSQLNYTLYVEKMRNEICASYGELYECEEYVLNGINRNKVLDEFKDDFYFVFGEEWLEKVSFSFHPQHKQQWIPSTHLYWMSQMALAKRGKVSPMVFMHGLSLGDNKDSERNLRFAQRVERYLHQSGVNIHFGLSTDPFMPGNGIVHTPSNYHGGTLEIQEKARYQTYRLW